MQPAVHGGRVRPAQYLLMPIQPVWSLMSRLPTLIPTNRFISLVCRYLRLALVVNQGRELMPVIHQRRE